MMPPTTRLLAAATLGLFLLQSGLCSLTAFGAPPPESRVAHEPATGSAPPACHGGPAGPPAGDVPASGDEQCQEHCRLYAEVLPGSAWSLDAAAALQAGDLAQPFLVLTVRTVAPQRVPRAPPPKRSLPILHSVFRI